MSEIAKMHELVKRKMIIRQDLLDLEDEIKDARREIKRSKPSWWQRFKSGMKRFWSRLFRWKLRRTKPLVDETEELLISPPRPNKLVTLAIDTPTPKKIVRPTPSFADNLSICSIETLTETLTESPEQSSFLQRFTSLRSSQRRVAPSSSWVDDVLGSSVSSRLSQTSDHQTSTLEIPELASDDLNTSLTRGHSSEDLYLYCYRS